MSNARRWEDVEDLLQQIPFNNEFIEFIETKFGAVFTTVSLEVPQQTKNKLEKGGILTMTTAQTKINKLIAGEVDSQITTAQLQIITEAIESLLQCTSPLNDEQEDALEDAIESLDFVRFGRGRRSLITKGHKHNCKCGKEDKWNI